MRSFQYWLYLLSSSFFGHWTRTILVTQDYLILWLEDRDRCICSAWCSIKIPSWLSHMCRRIDMGYTTWDNFHAWNSQMSKAGTAQLAFLTWVEGFLMIFGISLRLLACSRHWKYCHSWHFLNEKTTTSILKFYKA